MDDKVAVELNVGGVDDKYRGPLEMTYDDVIAEWNKVRANDVPQPGSPVEWRLPSGERGVLREGETIKAEDGLELSIDPGHLS